MSTIGRRLFAGMFAAAPLAANTRMPDPAPQWRNFALDGMVKDAMKVAAPPQLKQYHEAMQAANEASHYTYRMRRYAERDEYMDPNILALKSVSAQHRIHMQIKADLARQEAEKTFADQLIDRLGLREYFKDRNLDAPEATAGYARY